MLDQLRAQMAAFLAAHDVCILSTAGAAGAWAMPARYLARGLEVDCLAPRWADVAYQLEQDPRVLLVIPSQISDPSTEPGLSLSKGSGQRFGFRISDEQTAPQSATLRLRSGQASPLVGGTRGGLRWLQIQGTAEPVGAPDWASLLPGWTSAVAPDDLYLVVRVTPARLDLFDERQGWGARETVEM